MMHLQAPVSPQDDDAVITAICDDPDWIDHAEAWTQAYGDYRDHGGDPWAVEPAEFAEDVKAAMYALYTSKRKSAALNAIRDTQLSSCPMCGSLGTGDLDHYLPRETFSEFSIMRANLVPACKHCNSSSKGKKYRGDEPERFIHPYFDAWANQPLWEVAINTPTTAATFTPRAIAGLDASHNTIVKFHLANVLGKQFERSVRNMWGSYPGVLSVSLSVAETETVTLEIEREIRRCTISRGINAWDTAFYRGLRANPDAIEVIRARLETLLSPEAAQ